MLAYPIWKADTFVSAATPYAPRATSAAPLIRWLTPTIPHHTGQALIRTRKSSAQLLTIWVLFPRLEYFIGTMATACKVCWFNPPH